MNSPVSSGSGASLSIDEVTFAIGGLPILTEVSFDVQPGEIFGIIGPNGAGKSSLYNCISGIYLPNRGDIRVNGGTILGLRSAQIARRGVGRTFQNLALFNNLNVVDNLMLGRHRLMNTGVLSGALWLGRTRREERAHREACTHIVDLLGLGQAARLPVGLLPYGGQKLVEVGRALASEPELLLLDEPAAGLNEEETEQISAILRNIHEQLSVTILLVEHDVAMVQQLADRICALNFGQVVQVGTPTEVVSHPTVREAYLGSAWD